MTSITIDQLKEIFTADPATGKIYRKNGKEAGSVCRVGKNGESYIRVQHAGKNYYAHRIVYALANGEWPEGSLDHENGDSLDNRLSNLKAGGQTANMKNRKSFVNESQFGRTSDSIEVRVAFH